MYKRQTLRCFVPALFKRRGDQPVVGIDRLVAPVSYTHLDVYKRQNLLNKAQSLGWKTEQIRVLDRDLGQSGAAATKRTDFKALVGDVAMGQIGAIFALEAPGWHDPTRTGIACSNCAPSPARS